MPYLYERDGTNCENLPETHEFLKRVRAEVDARYRTACCSPRRTSGRRTSSQYFGDGDECHMAFHFPVMPRMFMAMRREDALPIVEILEQTPAIPENAQWGLFLRNHDELTLEMVTDEERDYMYAEYAKDPRMKLNLGIRRRLAPLLDNGRDEIELMHAILFSLPGSPVLYYGDEIGMGDNIFLGDRDGVRTPMQWTGDRNGGFSRADFAQLYLPPLMDPVYGYQAVNVEAQLRQPNSLLRWLHRLIALRKEHPVFGLGTYEALRPENPRIFAHVRTLRGRHRALRPQPRALGAGGRARPLAVGGHRSRRRCSAARASRGSASCRICSRSRREGSSGSSCGKRKASDDEQRPHRVRHEPALVRLEDARRHPRDAWSTRASCAATDPRLELQLDRGPLRHGTHETYQLLTDDGGYDALGDPRQVRELVHLMRGARARARARRASSSSRAVEGFAATGELREARASAPSSRTRRSSSTTS